MKNDKRITYEFIRYIHQAMIHEKIKYIQKSDKKRLDRSGFKIVHDENLINNINCQNNGLIETIPLYNFEILEFKRDYENLEVYMNNANLAKSIEKLTRNEKLILFMKFVERKKDTEIAREFGITSQAVSKRKLGILKKLSLQVRRE